MDEQTQTPAPAVTQEAPSSFSSFMDSRKGDVSAPNSTEKLVADRGTQQADTKQTDSTNNKTAGADEADADKTNAPASGAEPKQVKQIKNRSQERIQELLEENKKLKEAQTQKTEALKPPQKQEIPQLVPPPQKPQYERKELKRLRLQAIQSGDVNLQLAVEDELEKHSAYDLEVAKWEYKNGEKWKENQAKQQYYQNLTLEKNPELKDQSSPLYQQYQSVWNRFNELQKDPAQLPYVLAELAQQRILASKSGALETDNKQLREKLAKYEKKMQPSAQVETVDKGEPSENDNPMSTLRRGLRAINPKLVS